METIWIVFFVILGSLGIFFSGYIVGSVIELGNSLRETKREIFELKRDEKALKQMAKDHEEHMANIERLEKNYQEALFWYNNQTGLGE